MMHFMRTTLNINDALLRELKHRAREERRPLTKVVNEVLQRGLGHAPQKRPVVKLPVFDLKIKDAYRGMSLNQLYDQLEAEPNDPALGAVAEE